MRALYNLSRTSQVTIGSQSADKRQGALVESGVQEELLA